MISKDLEDLRHRAAILVRAIGDGAPVETDTITDWIEDAARALSMPLGQSAEGGIDRASCIAMWARTMSVGQLYLLKASVSAASTPAGLMLRATVKAGHTVVESEYDADRDELVEVGAWTTQEASVEQLILAEDRRTMGWLGQLYERRAHELCAKAKGEFEG